MNRKKFILTALCLVLVLGMMVAPTLAYFTDYATAEGAVAVKLGYKTTITEDVPDNAHKVLHIKNEGPEACWVRAKGVASGDVKLTYSGDGWKADEDGWYVYDGILEGGKEATALTVTIEFPEGYEGDQKNVVVLHESAKVIYGENGDPVTPPDWTMEANLD
jgi:predicted ribosomally synthesized peptide with SipW-like signal peptide